MIEVAEQKPELKVPTTVKVLLEALIFAAQEPLSIHQIKAIYSGGLQNDPAKQIDADTVRALIGELNNEYEQREKAYRILKIAGGYQFATIAQYAEWIGKLYREQGRRKLSQSGIETLAIIAYKQPTTKAEIEHIRGVNCDYVLKSLLEKELATVTGRAETVGRPLLYGTTREFLKYFGLNEITDLPRPREIEEILGEPQFETERRMLEAQAGAEQMRKEQEDFKSRLPHIPKRKSELEEKPAEIIARTRVRRIKTVAALPQTPEPMLQQQIDFPVKSESNELPSSEIERETEPVLPVLELLPVEPVFSAEVETPRLIVLKSPEAMEEAPPVTAQVEEKITSTEMLEGREQASKKTTWQNWKEKIRGFIKKLFV